jgi:arginine:ornithine antiporter/lysine permease
MLYGPGQKFVLLSIIIFAVGIPVFGFAQRENSKPRFTKYAGIAPATPVLVACVALAIFKGVKTIQE